MVYLINIQLSVIACFSCYFCKSKLQVESHIAKNSIVIEFKNISRDSIYFYYNLQNFKLKSQNKEVGWVSDDQFANISIEGFDSLLNRRNEYSFENIDGYIVQKELCRITKKKYIIANNVEKLDSIEEDYLYNDLKILESYKGIAIFLRPMETYSVELNPDFFKKDKPVAFIFKEPSKSYFFRYFSYYNTKLGKKIKVPSIPPKVLCGFNRYDKGFKTKCSGI